MMIGQLKDLVSNKGKALAISVLLIAGLWHHPVFAEQRYQVESVDAAIALLSNDSLSDENLDLIRGQGLKALPLEQPSLGVILWDEGKVRKGTRNSLGNQVSTITIRVSVEGH